MYCLCAAIGPAAAIRFRGRTLDLAALDLPALDLPALDLPALDLPALKSAAGINSFSAFVQKTCRTICEQLNRFLVRNAAEQLDHSAAGEEPDLAGCERVAASQKPECVNYAPMVSGCRVVRENAFVKKCRKSARMSHLEENTMFFFIQRNPTAIHRFVRYRCGIAPNSQCIGQLRLVSSLWIMNQ